MGARPSEGGPIATLLLAIDQFRERRATVRTPYEMGLELIDFHRTFDLLHIELSKDAAAFAATDEFDRQGYLSPIAWMNENCDTSSYAASTAVTVGEQVDSLPRSMEAVTNREIGFSHLALMARTSDALKQSPTSTGSFDEEPLLKRAREHSVLRFRHDCTHARHQADAKAFLLEHVDAVDYRRLHITPWDGGGLSIHGFLDPVGGAAVRTALEPLARPSGPDDDRDRPKRLADALVELATHGLDEGVIPQRASQRPHLQVTTTVETLKGMEGAPAGELDFSSPVPAETVQRLACDATLTRILLGPDSAVIDVGRSKRIASGATRRALELRDRGCVWPGCDRPASWTAAHHLQHWAHGGATDRENLVLICHRHHWMVHEGGWQLVRGEDHELLTLPPVPWFGYPPTARAPDHVSVA